MEAPAAFFLDRDGVINEKAAEGHYVTSWEQFRFLPGAVEGIRKLGELGAPTIIVTNQRGVSLGIMDDVAVREIHGRMVNELARHGAPVDAVYFCPHGIGECECRKPDTGMFLAAQSDLGLKDLSTAVVVGDSPSDMEAAARLGARGILLDARESTISGPINAWRKVVSLDAAADLLTAEMGRA